MERSWGTTGEAGVQGQVETYLPSGYGRTRVTSLRGVRSDQPLPRRYSALYRAGAFSPRRTGLVRLGRISRGDGSVKL